MRLLLKVSENVLFYGINGKQLKLLFRQIDQITSEKKKKKINFYQRFVARIIVMHFTIYYFDREVLAGAGRDTGELYRTTNALPTAVPRARVYLLLFDPICRKRFNYSSGVPSVLSAAVRVCSRDTIITRARGQMNPI